MDLTNKPSPRIMPGAPMDASMHDHNHNRRVVLWAVLIVIILALAGTVAWMIYAMKKEQAFRAYYAAQEQASQSAYLEQVAHAPTPKPMTAAEQKAYFDAIKKADAQSQPQNQTDQAAYFNQITAREQALEAAARAEYEQNH